MDSMVASEALIGEHNSQGCSRDSLHTKKKGWDVWTKSIDFSWSIKNTQTIAPPLLSKIPSNLKHSE